VATATVAGSAAAHEHRCAAQSASNFNRIQAHSHARECDAIRQVAMFSSNIRRRDSLRLCLPGLRRSGAAGATGEVLRH